MLRIGIDRISNVAAPAGIVNYARQFLREAESLDIEINFYEYGRSYSLYKSNSSVVGMLSSKNKVEVIARIKRIEILRKIYRELNKKYFSFITKRAAFTFFHAFYYRPPSIGLMPFIPVVYDLSYIRYPDFHPKERVSWMRELEPYLLKNHIVHTISEFSKSEIISVFGISPRNVHVIKPLVDQLFLKNETVPQTILTKFGLEDKSFFVAVGTLEPRKNLVTLIDAFGMLPKKERINFPLVIVGQPGWDSVDFVKRYDKLSAEGSLKILGFVSNRDLRTLYRSALKVCFPAIYEGFGMPAAEAVCAGGSVVASDIASLREATRGLAEYIDSLNVTAWSFKMLESIDLRESDVVYSATDRKEPTKPECSENAGKIVNLYSSFLETI